MSAHTIVGIGEVLWDLLPAGRQVGGAPANFAYCSNLLGNRGIVVSRVGSDLLGAELCQELQVVGVSTDFIQTDHSHPTGTVKVKVDSSGQPEFEIKQQVAWDFLGWSSALEHLARSCDVVCFGTLAQRSEQSRTTIMRFLDAAGNRALRILDVNLRQSFYSAETLRDSLRHADGVKLNRDELPIVAGLLEFDANEFCAKALKTFGLKFICVTRGEKGSVLYESGGVHDHPGFQVRVKDSVGAGDAFTAGLVYEYLRAGSWSAMNETGNRMGAWVASRSGGMPAADNTLRDVLAEQQPG